MTEVKTKPSTFRLGGALKLGIVGEIFDPWYLNTSIGIGVVNFVGKEDSRGELLTPSRRYENIESPLNLLLFTLLIQYRL